MAELLLEILSEEIPARMQLNAADDFKNILQNNLTKQNITYENVSSYVTPRRLTLCVEGLPEKLEDKAIERKGPRVGAPEKALEGFLRSVNMSENQLEKRTTPKGEFYFAHIKESGNSLYNLLPEIVNKSISDLKWPKSMAWGNNRIRWVRPIENICCVFNGEVLPVSFGHYKANTKSRGHRFLGSDYFTVSSFDQYKKQLVKQYVMLDHSARKSYIASELQKLAASKNIIFKKDEGLLEEVSGLVEYPVVLLGNIDEKFMRVPQEVLISSMRSHQKYFSFTNENGSLAPYFAVVSNNKTDDNQLQITKGNERVLRARLSDAAFFWDNDLKHTLESRTDDLKKVIFHKKLGTVYDKVERISALSKLISVWVPHANLLHVEQAAKICKSDLTTSMVIEFTDLQGVMGGYYAKSEGLHEDIINAVRNHYKPQGPSDSFPTNPVAIAIALADKIDTIVGLFAIDEKPTSSKDPYALRRAALGIIRIIIENNLNIPLQLLFEKAIAQYPKGIFKTAKEGNLAVNLLKRATFKDERESHKKIKRHNVVDDLMAFFTDRLKYLLKNIDIKHDLINAIFNDGAEDDMLRSVKRVKILEEFINSESGKNLLAVYRRAANIVAIEEKRDGLSYNNKPLLEVMTQKEEQQLYKLLRESKEPIIKAVKEDRFEDAMMILSDLRPALDGFFDAVTVNCDNSEVRANRLKLLSNIRRLVDKVADFSQIEG
jgi:glycyl-tRNA synthetase beta chain